MRILIDETIGIEVQPDQTSDEDGQPQLTLDFTEVGKVMEAWMVGDPSRRSYRYGNDDDSDGSPCTIIAAWVMSHNASLAMVDINPFYDGLETHSAYALADLAEALPAGMLKWGAEIGEGVPA